MGKASEIKGGWRFARREVPTSAQPIAVRDVTADQDSQLALKAIANSDMTLFAQNLDLAYVWTCNTSRSWLADVRLGSSDDDVLAPDAAADARQIKSDVLKTGEAARYELLVSASEGARWFDVRLDADRDSAGRIVGLVGTSTEITEHKRREDTLKTLLRELSHRSKNLLAIIQSLASQTARHSVTVPEFLVRFRGRIQSLSSSQDIVTESDWRGADLSGLVASQVERYAPSGMQQVRLYGTDVYLSPSAALHVGLALHELAVNAASYGSLSSHAGHVVIESDLVEENGDRFLRFTWHEFAGPRVQADHDTRFGTSTLERIVPNAVGGHASLRYQPEGVVYSLTIPEAHYEIIDSLT